MIIKNKLQTHFLEVNNIQEFKRNINSLYANTILKFKEKLDLYHLELNEADHKRSSELHYLIYELYDSIEQLEDKKFTTYFINWTVEFGEKIRYITVNKHTHKCIIRAIFDIIFKYAFDINYIISYSCCNTHLFRKLEFDILTDCSWKI